MNNNMADHIRDELFAAIRGRDERAFQQCCSTHQGMILTNFGNWQRSPESIRDDEKAVEEYGHALLTIANHFESMGHPELLEQLKPPADLFDSVSVRFAEANDLAARQAYEASNALIKEVLHAIERWRGPGVAGLRAKVYGLLGTNYFRLLQFENARRYTELALMDCKAIGDQEGIRIYLENLQVLKDAGR
jgi:tetratricopeptide (TPR) repeat protein